MRNNRTCCTLHLPLSAKSTWMMFASLLFIAVAVLTAEICQALPEFQHGSYPLSNNSFIYYPDIGDSDSALRCVTNKGSCCNVSNTGGWRDESRRPVHQGVDGVACLYVTRGDGVISLNRKLSCSDHTSGLWRCDIPDSSGEMQSLYIYISNRGSYGEFITSFCTIYSLLHWNTGQLNPSVSMNFTLHTEPNASVPEFTISCRTHGGPATTVQWTVNGVSVQEDSDHETSQLILDTSLNSVYDNRLRVRGRRNGTYNCSVSNNIKYYLNNDGSFAEVNGSERVSGNYYNTIFHIGS